MSEAPPLSALTTLGLGGPADRLVVAEDEQQLIETVIAADRGSEPLLLLGGGSNLVVADGGFRGTAVLVATRGIRRTGTSLTVAAGEPWDALVGAAVTAGLAGIEALAGIPGSTGATPIQNVGAYGQEVGQTVTGVRVFDRRLREMRSLSSAECEFAYRTSRFKRDAGRWVVLDVTFALVDDGGASRPVRYAELAAHLGVEVGATATLGEVRAGVLRLRSRKGMVLDPADPDTRSVGSFFTNPIVPPATLQSLQAHHARVPHWEEPDGRVKLSAAWLVQEAGFARGHGSAAVRISTKHTLALTHRGGGSTGELLALAAEIRDGVRDRLGITLEPEPNLVGCSL